MQITEERKENLNILIPEIKSYFEDNNKKLMVSTIQRHFSLGYHSASYLHSKILSNCQEYHFPISSSFRGTCTQQCNLKREGVMIGSNLCQDCIFCVEKDTNEINSPEWIKCIRINEAIGDL